MLVKVVKIFYSLLGPVILRILDILFELLEVRSTAIPPPPPPKSPSSSFASLPSSTHWSSSLQVYPTRCHVCVDYMCHNPFWSHVADLLHHYSLDSLMEHKNSSFGFGQKKKLILKFFFPTAHEGVSSSTVYLLLSLP